MSEAGEDETRRAGRQVDDGLDDVRHDGLGDLLDDLEQQAAGLVLAERDAELVDRARGEYAGVSFSSRVHASLGRRVSIGLLDGRRVEGRVDEAGEDWCLLTVSERAAAADHAPGTPSLCLVRTGAVTYVAGLSQRALPEAARPVTARLGLGSALHRVAGPHLDVVVGLTTGHSSRGRLRRVGADFVELSTEGGDVLVLRFEAIASVRTGEA